MCSGVSRYQFKLRQAELFAHGRDGITNLTDYTDKFAMADTKLVRPVIRLPGGGQTDAASHLRVQNFVRTEMGTSAATLSIEESIPLVVEAVERSRGRAGLRFIDRNGRTLPW